MKIAAIAAAIVFSAGAAAAQSGGMSTTAGDKTCLQTRDIDHTHAVDATNVLFYMRNGQIWQSTTSCSRRMERCGGTFRF